MAAVISAVALIAATLIAVSGPSAAAGAAVVTDSFTRSVSAGFGSAPTGGAYAYPQTVGLSVNGSQGVMAMSASLSRTALVGPANVANVDAVTSFGLSALPTAGSVYLGQNLRATSAGASFTPRLRIMPDKTIYLGFRSVGTDGVATAVGTDVTAPFAMAAGARLALRTQIEGSVLRARVWIQGTAEPTSWQLSASSSLLPGAGQFGIWGYLGGSTNSMNITVDDVAVTSPHLLPLPHRPPHWCGPAHRTQVSLREQRLPSTKETSQSQHQGP